MFPFNLFSSKLIISGLNLGKAEIVMHSFIKHVHQETGTEPHAGHILSNKMSQVTILEEGEHAGANNRASTKGTGWGPTSERAHIRALREGFLVEVMLELASEG